MDAFAVAVATGVALVVLLVATSIDALAVGLKPAFLTRVRREAVETGVDTRRATEGPGDVVDTTSRSPTERNAVDMPVSAAAAEAW